MYFTDDDGAPLSGGKVYTYAAGTTTPKASYTTAAGTVENTNPVILDSSGRAVIFIDGSYKFVVTTSADVTIRTVDNVTSFSALDSQSDTYFESFSGNGTQTAFTASEDLGTDEKAIWVWVDKGLQQHVTNGTFATDTGWTKGAGWTIGSGVATAAGAISTAIEQTSAVALLAGQAYIVTMTITRSAGSLTPSVGGTAGTARSSNGTYVETIIAGSTQVLAFTGSGFTGTLDTVTVTPAVSAGYQIQSPTAYTINGTALTFNTAPPSGTGNIYVSAPLLAVGSASSSAAAAQAAEAAALVAAGLAAAAAGYTYTYSSTTTASDPGAGFLRFNNSTLASATALYISETTGDSQAISADLLTWDDSTSTIRGKLRVFKQTDASVFALFNITGTVTDNGTWDTFTVAYVAGSGTISDTNEVTVQFIRNGDKGDTGAQGPTGSIDDLTGVPTADIAAADYVIFQDVTDSNDTKRDTVQGILDLVPVSNTNAGHATNRYYWGYGYNATSATIAAVADRLYGTGFVVGEEDTFTRIGIEVTTLSAGNARLGIYRLEPDMTTAALILDAGTVDTGTTGLKEVTISQLLAPGFYVLAVVFSATPTVRIMSSSSRFTYQWHGSDDVDGTLQPTQFYRSFTYGALPNPFGGTITFTGVNTAIAKWLRKV